MQSHFLLIPPVSHLLSAGGAGGAGECHMAPHIGHPFGPSFTRMVLTLTSFPPTDCHCLQEELEAYDKYQRQLEDTLDAKTAELITLRKVWQNA